MLRPPSEQSGVPGGQNGGFSAKITQLRLTRGAIVQTPLHFFTSCTRGRTSRRRGRSPAHCSGVSALPDPGARRPVPRAPLSEPPLRGSTPVEQSAEVSKRAAGSEESHVSSLDGR
ncbi:hypothetical protein T484DRAFT_1938913 [Baffinella frigidus]|nr:hypothetical protein T484DRAFT_1938913 [Cryptophyta sp. CCMP2293]